MICDKCRHMGECFEQRGRCAEFETEKQYRKRIRNEIEMLNKTEASTGAADSDEDSQEQPFRRLRENDLREADPNDASGAADPAET